MDKESLERGGCSGESGEQIGSCETHDASPATIKTRVLKRRRGLKHPSDCEAARPLSLNVTVMANSYENPGEVGTSPAFLSQVSGVTSVFCRCCL